MYDIVFVYLTRVCRVELQHPPWCLLQGLQQEPGIEVTQEGGDRLVSVDEDHRVVLAKEVLCGGSTTRTGTEVVHKPKGTEQASIKAYGTDIPKNVKNL